MKVGHERPINSTAAAVTSNGQHHEYKATHLIYDSPFPMPTWLPGNPNFIDMTGQRFGRLTVFGYSKEFPHKWVCRCACGMYCIRKTKALTSTTHPVIPCHQCYRLAAKKKSEYFKATGRDSEISQFL